MKRQKPRAAPRSAREDAHAPSSSVATVTVGLVVATASFIAFLPALHNQFVNWDDYETLVSNTRYRGVGWDYLRWMFTTFYMGHYQPLSWVSFALDYLIWGTNPVGYHLTNLILHAVNALLFFLVARSLLLHATADQGTQAGLALTLGAGLAALLFSLHPLRVESVVWATERRDVLSSTFYFLTLYAYVTANGRRRWILWSIVFYLLSLLAKGTAMTMPAVLMLLDVYPLRRLPGKPSAWLKPDCRPVLLEKLPYVALAAVFAVTALLAQEHTGALRPVQEYFFSYRIGQAFYALYFYLAKTLVPTGLSPLYELPYDFDAWMPFFYLCGLGALVLTVALFLVRRRWPALLAAWLYYLILLAPVAGLAQSGPQLVADRYSYLSCLSWALLFGAVFQHVWSEYVSGGGSRYKAHAMAGAGSVVLVILGLMSWEQSKVWRDTTTLWRHVIAVTPESSIAHYNLGRTFEDEGRLEESLEHYRRSVEINPANADALYNLARLLAKRNMISEAIAGYRQALKIRPNDAEAHNNLGLLLARQGSGEAAAAEFHTAIKLDPNYGKAYYNLGRLYAERRDHDNALEHFRRALRLNPDQPEILLALADALARAARFDEAEAQLRRLIVLKPNLPDAHAAMARTLAAQGKKEAAERHFQEGLRLLQRAKPTS